MGQSCYIYETFVNYPHFIYLQNCYINVLTATFQSISHGISGVRALRSRYLFGSILNFHFCTEKRQKINVTADRKNVQIRSDSIFSNIFKDMNCQMVLPTNKIEEFSY